MLEYLKDLGPIFIKKEDGFDQYRKIELKRR